MKRVDKNREDYADYEPPQRRARWTLAQVLVLVAIVLIALPMLAGILFWGLIAMLGGFQH